MAIATSILVFLHVLGATMVVGIWLGTFKRGVVLPGQFHAALLQIITGFALYFIGMSGNAQMPTAYHMVVGIKMVLGLCVAVAAFLGQKKYKAAKLAGNPEAGRNVALAHATGGLGLIALAFGTLGLDLVFA